MTLFEAVDNKQYSCTSIYTHIKSLKSGPLNTATGSVGKKEQDTISKPLNNEQGSYKEKVIFDGMPKSCRMNCWSITFTVNINYND